MEPYMETLLKRKRIWKYTKVIILDLTDEWPKFVIIKKEDEVFWVITTYIQGIFGFIQVISIPLMMFDKVNESQVMEIEK